MKSPQVEKELLKTMDMKHLDYLRRVVDEDVEHVLMKEETYKGSWKKRGGVGAFMMLARKWDRLQGMLEDYTKQYNIFDLIMTQSRLAEGGHQLRLEKGPVDIGADGTVLAEVRATVSPGRMCRSTSRSTGSSP